METTWTRFSMCLNVDGFLRNNKFPRGYDIFQNDDGTELRPEEALAYLHTEKAKGHKVIPCGEDCGNPCKNADKGCAGFDYSGGGYRGTATAGYRGTATAGYRGTATAGESGEIRIQWWDSKARRYRTKIGYVGEDGIKPDTAYRLNDNHEFEEVQP